VDEDPNVSYLIWLILNESWTQKRKSADESELIIGSYSGMTHFTLQHNDIAERDLIDVVIYTSELNKTHFSKEKRHALMQLRGEAALPKCLRYSILVPVEI
jgi:hypothetical protein